MIQKTLYEDVLMRNPFDENDTATKQELSNYVFYGRKSKYDDIQFTHQQVFPHLLKNHIENMLNSADSLKRQCRDLHSLLDVLYRKFIIVLRAVFGYDAVILPVQLSDSNLQLFLRRLFKGEISFLEMIRTFKKRNRIISCILHNKSFSRDLLQKIVSNEPLKHFMEHNDDGKELFFLYCSEYKDDAEIPEENRFFEDLRRLLHLEVIFSQNWTMLPSIPTELHEKIFDFFKLSYYLISDDEQYIPPLDNITIDNITYATFEPLPDNQIKITNKSILFQNINFNNDDAMNVIQSAIQYNRWDFEYIGFNLCYFEKGFILDSVTDTKHNIFFKDCTFSKSFRVKNCFLSTLIRFYNCTFFGKVIFGKNPEVPYLPCDIEIRDSVFKPYSIFEMTNITEMKGYHYGKVAIINTIINGNLKFTNLSKDANTLFSIHNIAITTPFVIENTYFNKGTVIDGLAFAMAPKQAMRDSINTFVQSLQESGLNKIAIANGLVIDDSDNSENVMDKDMQAYKIACESGFLKPKYAASYLGMSKDNLAKKRMADKQRITRESIPYVGQGKSISYPKDALDAYNLQDWDLLKKLREKYAQKDTETDDSE